MAKNTTDKQQIIDSIKDSEAILVTVSRNPSVDELSAALGFTLLANKMDKHATAVFSGDIPPAINFLKPEKTFEDTTDSLRDFIIALDKEKADHLRYKVDGDLVKIFITPYKTKLGEKDLDFSQGDYNVDMVVAIGVDSEDDLDTALSDHGRIMHDAVVASLTCGRDRSDFGTLVWHEPGVSSYSEMIASFADKLRTDKALLDEQISTAFLTGIVAATDRFSNEMTSSETMTVAAQLMAAGANQQLISNKLQAAEERPSPVRVKEEAKNKASKPAEASEAKDTPAVDGSLTISHENKGDVDEVAKQVAAKDQKKAVKAAENELAESLNKAAAEVDQKPSVEDLQKDLQAETESLNNQAEEKLPPIISDTKAVGGPTKLPEVPAFGGTLNATSEQAEKDKLRALQDEKNKTILSHGGDYVNSAPSNLPGINSVTQPGQVPETGVRDVFGGNSTNPVLPDTSITAKVADIAPQSGLPPLPSADTSVPLASAGAGQTLADLDEQNRANTTDAQAAVAAAFSAAPSQAAPGVALPEIPSLPPLPPLPGEPGSGLPPLPNDVSAGLPPLPNFGAPAAGFSAPASPEQQLDSVIQPPAQAQMPVQPTPPDPSQFQIPGQ